MKRTNPIPRQAYFFLFTLSFFLIQACPEPPKDNTPPRDTTIHLEVLSTFTTTARLHISVEDTTGEWTFGLTRNNEDVLTATVYNSDTTFTDNGLTPNTEYIYQVQWLNNGISVDSSLAVTAQTMDTTSHNFTWEIDTLGGYGSYLKDVAIVDENNIWVVGMIKIPDPDSSFNGTGWESYNAAYWDGTEWELMGIYSNTLGLYSIQYFAEDDIWVMSSYPIHWDGNTWTYYHLTNMGIIPGGLRGEIWGTSSNNIYFVGAHGRIVHYDGSTFTEMDSGTEIDLLDVHGNGENVFATGYEQTGTWAGHSIALAYEEGEWVTVRHEDEFQPFGVSDWGLISSVWAGEDEAYFMTYAGIKYYVYLTGKTGIKYTMWEMMTSTDHIVKIRANNVNDILLVGRPGSFYHFNGMNWYKNIEIENQYDVYIAGMDFQENIFVTVGWYHPSEQSIIVRGSRIE